MQQLSDEWFLAHVGVITGSKMDTIVNGGDRAWITLLNKMKAEIENPQLILEKGYQSAGMERGIILEHEAVDHYELIHNVDVERPAFVTHDALSFIGCSPDFWRPKEKIVGEVKCPSNPEIHMMTVVYGSGAETYKPQTHCEALCTGAELIHFVSYDPRVKDPSKQLKLIELEPDEGYIHRMVGKCEEFYEYLTTDTRPQARSDNEIPTFF